MTAVRKTPPPPRRGIASTQGGQIHYRFAGDGPPVLLFGALPSTISSDDPVMQSLADTFQVFAPDPPGHGLSDAPSGELLAAFIEPLADFITQLACGAIPVIGQDWGGALALALLESRPDLVSQVLLVGSFDPTKVLPSWIEPAIDGTHLIAQWDEIVRNCLFDPPDSSRFADRVAADLPFPGALHARLIDRLRARRWSDVLRTGLSLLDLNAARSRHEARVFDATADKALAALVQTGSRSASIPRNRPPSGTIGSLLIDLPDGQLFARGDLDQPGLPLLGLHDQAGASRRLDAFIPPFSGQRPVLTIDMPGNGGSDALLAPDDVSIAQYARVVAAALDALGIERCDVIGRYSGGQTAVELALRRPTLVSHIVIAGVMIFDPADRDEHLAHYAPSIAPVWDGSHLLTAWMAFRSQNLWWPWYDRRAAAMIHRDADLRPAVLHDRIVDALVAGPFYRAAYHASFRYPMAERLRALDVPCLLADIPGTASYARIAQAQAAAPACQSADLPEDATLWPAMLARFFAD